MLLDNVVRLQGLLWVLVVRVELCNLVYVYVDWQEFSVFQVGIGYLYVWIRCYALQYRCPCDVQLYSSQFLENESVECNIDQEKYSCNLNYRHRSDFKQLR